MNASNDTLSFFSASLILFFGAFGVTTNASIVSIFKKERSERTSFNLICVFRAVSNIIILSATFLMVFFVKICLGFSIYSETIESWLIHLSLTLYLGNEYQIILVALNRFSALFIPVYYPKIWGFIITSAYLSLIYLYRLVKMAVEQAFQTLKGCHTSFSIESLAWNYDPNPDCHVDDNILDVIFYTFIIMTIINFITFLKIIHFYWTRNVGNSMDRENKKRMKRNIYLFFQTMIQDSLYLIDLTFTFKLSSWSSHRFWTFLSSTLVWECIHSIDGFIMMMFNERLSLFKKRFQSTPSVTMTNTGRRNLVTTTTVFTLA